MSYICSGRIFEHRIKHKTRTAEDMLQSRPFVVSAHIGVSIFVRLYEFKIFFVHSCMFACKIIA